MVLCKCLMVEYLDPWGKASIWPAADGSKRASKKQRVSICM